MNRRLKQPATVHVYRAKDQPATNFVDHCPFGGKPTRFRRKPRALLWCSSCGRQRWAKNLRVQVYYDCIRFFCSGGCRK